MALLQRPTIVQELPEVHYNTHGVVNDMRNGPRYTYSAMLGSNCNGNFSFFFGIIMREKVRGLLTKIRGTGIVDRHGLGKFGKVILS
jgi:hypothetical protein